MSTVALKLNESLKKRTQFPISFLQSKTTFSAGIQVYVEKYHLGGKEGANHLPKGPQTRSVRGGGR